MNESNEKSPHTWDDHDDAPEWTEEQLARAELAINGKVVRAAQGTLTRPRGRPKSISVRKEHVNLRIDPALVAKFRATGKGWQTRMHQALEEWFIHHPAP